MPANFQTGRYLTGSLGLALAYFAVGLLSMGLAIPPVYATPLYPAAGLALAAMLALGPRQAPGLFIGAVAINAVIAQAHGVPSWTTAVGAGVGAVLQALFGAWAIRRTVAQPLVLSEPRDLALFFGLGAGVACVISPTIGCAALLAVGSINASQFPSTWAAWWLGDTLGVLIGAPIVLALIGQPRSAWAPRRLSVALPMLVTTGLVALAIVGVTDWEQQRSRNVFERDAASASSALEIMLREPLMALQGSRSALQVAPTLGRDGFRKATAAFLSEDGPLQALGLARRVARAGVPAFDAAAQAEGLAGYNIHDRRISDDDMTPPADEDVVAIRLIEPLARNAAALGVNVRSVAGSRAALARSTASGEAAATPGIQLSQAAHRTIGVVVYQALFDGAPATAAEREAALRGAVFATLRPDLLVQRVLRGAPAYLSICLIDTEPGTLRPRLAGDEGCEKLDTRAVPTRLRRLAFGGRDWEIRVLAPKGIPIDDGRSWPFALVGLVSTALLGVLLLMMTGRAQRIEELVLERTDELRREVAGHAESAQALVASERRFRNIFEHAPVGIVFTNPYGVIKDTNPHFRRLVGYTEEHLRGLRSQDITHPDDGPEDLRLALQLLNGEVEQYRRHKRYVDRQGQIVQVRVTVSALRKPDGKVHRLVGVVEDIADQLKMQELARAAQAAAAANQAKTEFLSRMSHELRTPLNAMLGFTQLMDIDATDPLAPRQRARTQQIQQAGWHLLEMINDTLDLSRIESGALKLEPARLALRQLLDDALSLVEADARARSLAIGRDFAPDALYAMGDVTRVKQVLTNLLSNAVKYNAEGGHITIRGRRASAGFVDIAIEDGGAGLSAEQLAGLFQPFNRLGREHGDTTGTGIGLVIAKRLAELMGGSLSAASTVGKGSTFTLRLPAGDAGPSRSLSSATAPQSGEAPRAPQMTGRRRIVYIEDNEMNAELMRGALEQRPLIDLQVFETGLAGLEAVLAAPPDLLLLDMQLPDIDGLDVLRRLRARWPAQTLPVVVVSANAVQAQIDASAAAGAQHYLTKPLDVRALLALLDQLLASPKEA
ncbi:CHASE domain-containing protein [Paucibacter sp. R3-3]|uniref:histidine kinase n=1 Tax=Roseateles agri TaxID=3098619 RepID=A0ABU5DGA2_9BURK|nr:CHASE domain-containing protein [Paucibacter sp. R3-3]MDY0744299.1 CHASE domain-containing protein [Paucibacter sp. R3-3]